LRAYAFGRRRSGHGRPDRPITGRFGGGVPFRPLRRPAATEIKRFGNTLIPVGQALRV